MSENQCKGAMSACKGLRKKNCKNGAAVEKRQKFFVGVW